MGVSETRVGESTDDAKTQGRDAASTLVSLVPPVGALAALERGDAAVSLVSWTMGDELSSGVAGVAEAGEIGSEVAAVAGTIVARGT